jgi:hypothetical protein
LTHVGVQLESIFGNAQLRGRKRYFCAGQLQREGSK